MFHHITDLSNCTVSTSSTINQSQSLNINGDEISQDKLDTNESDTTVPTFFFTDICTEDSYCNSYCKLNAEIPEIDIKDTNNYELINNSNEIDVKLLNKSGVVIDRDDGTNKKEDSKKLVSNCLKEVIKTNNLNDYSWNDVNSTRYTNHESITNIYNNSGQTSCNITKSMVVKSNFENFNTTLLTKETGKNEITSYTGNVVENKSSICLTIGLHDKFEINKDKMLKREMINNLLEIDHEDNKGRIERKEMDLRKEDRNQDDVAKDEYKKDGEKWTNGPRVCHKSNLKRSLEETGSLNECRKRAKKSISFDKVSVYYFQRTQGFICVPSKGGSTLGMSHNHSYTRNFSLNEYATEQKRVHRQQLLSSNNQSLRSQFPHSGDDSEDSEEVDDVEYDNNANYIQPIPTRERRAILRSAGVDKIESSEKEDCKAIRISREYCGCQCQTYCNPDTCICSQSGIKCQMDRLNFPCSCTRDGCRNVNGRIEFNAHRVRTHYIQTLMRMRLDNKTQPPQQNHINFPFDYYTSSPMENVNFNYDGYIDERGASSYIDSIGQHTYQSTRNNCCHAVSQSLSNTINVSSYGSTCISRNSSLMNNWSNNGLMDNHNDITKQCVMDNDATGNDILCRYVECHTNSYSTYINNQTDIAQFTATDKFHLKAYETEEDNDDDDDNSIIYKK